jgi:hypothetical protein
MLSLFGTCFKGTIKLVRQIKIVDIRAGLGHRFWLPDRNFQIMKKIILFLVLIVSISFSSVAQTDNDYKDLLTVFVSGKYEKCLYKAEGYTLDDKTKKDALPYMFMSRCFYEMSKKDEFKEKYPKAFSDAMKYAVKYAAKDKDRKHYADYEDFFIALRTDAMTEAETQYDNQKWPKAKTIYDQLTDLDPNDAGAWMMLSMTQVAQKAKKEAETSAAKAKDLMENKKASTSPEQLKLMKYGLEKFCTDLKATNRGEAKKWMDWGLEYFPEDPEYKVIYDEITH